MDIPWSEVDPLPEVNGTVEPVLATVDALRTAWDNALRRVLTEEFAEARRRSLRRHAIETGIIERLYDLDWGVTEALVAEGITAEVAAREGGVSEGAFALIRDQLNALEYLTLAVREGQHLSVFFVRELHQLITRHQPTYEARDALGGLVQVPLPRGEWKTQPNHVRRSDGSLLQYTPPEHVQSQMELLVKRYAETAGAHPVIRAAWLHHRFIRIHPFADGNGRVARALTLLALLQAHYAPLVVDRRNRADYIGALDAANDGDLRPLIRLFAQLEIVALRTELERPAVVALAAESAVNIARAYAERLRPLRRGTQTQEVRQTEAFGGAVQRRVRTHLQSVADSLAATFRTVDPATTATVRLDSPTPVLYWSVRLDLDTLDAKLKYLVRIASMAEPTVLRVDIVATAKQPAGRDAQPGPLINPAPTDTVTLLANDDLDRRWPEIEELLDRTLAATVDSFGRGLTA
ncbi:MAG TPA: Fic family protein [Micromonosporaceae bacterium]|nr:Fic family protein [Micromonosporaceae bacterium]